MQRLYLEIDNDHLTELADHAMEAVKSFHRGYGAGNCSPDSIAFWTSVEANKKGVGGKDWTNFVIEVKDAGHTVERMSW
jgi:hypothetical protein